MLYVHKRAAGADNDIYVEHMEVLLYGEARGLSEIVGYFLNEWVREVGNFKMAHEGVGQLADFDGWTVAGRFGVLRDIAAGLQGSNISRDGAGVHV